MNSYSQQDLKHGISKNQQAQLWGSWEGKGKLSPCLKETAQQRVSEVQHPSSHLKGAYLGC